MVKPHVASLAPVKRSRRAAIFREREREKIGGEVVSVRSGKLVANTSVPMKGPRSVDGRIGLAVKRYDGGSGTATFNGTVMFRPGQMTAANLSNCSLWRRSTELPIYVSALEGLHTDGSLKAAQVQTELNVSDANAVDLSFVIDRAPTAGSVTPIDPNRAWCLAPTLLYCTDADHMCSSRIAPMPLVPLDHPNMTADCAAFLSKANFLTNWLEAWEGDSERQIQNATYNWVYACWCHYLCTGDPDVFRYGLRCISSFDSDGDAGLWGHGATNGDGTISFHNDIQHYIPNRAEYDPYGDMSLVWGSTAEAYDCSMDAWGCYYGTGSEIWFKALQGRSRNWYTFRDNSYLAGNDAYTYRRYEDPRNAYRRNWSPSVWAMIAGDNETLPMPGWGSINTTTYFDNDTGTIPLSRKVDQIEAWANDADPSEVFYGAQLEPWAVGVWAMHKDNEGDGSCSSNYWSAFQAEILHAAFLPYYSWIDADSRIGPGLKSICAYIRSIISGPFSTGSGTRYHLGYCIDDPADVAANQASIESGVQSSPNGSGSQFPYMVLHMLAWEYAYDGNTAARDLFDGLTALGSPVAPGDKWKTRKYTGQAYTMAFHGAAWRAGAPSLGY